MASYQAQMETMKISDSLRESDQGKTKESKVIVSSVAQIWDVTDIPIIRYIQADIGSYR